MLGKIKNKKKQKNGVTTGPNYREKINNMKWVLWLGLVSVIEGS